MTDGDLLRTIKLRCLAARSIDRTSTLPTFLQALQKASKEDRERLYVLIDRLDADGVSKWVDELQDRDIETMSMRSLRDLARRMGVSYVSTLTRSQLILGIHARRDRIAKSEHAKRDLSSQSHGDEVRQDHCDAGEESS